MAILADLGTITEECTKNSIMGQVVKVIYFLVPLSILASLSRRCCLLKCIIIDREQEEKDLKKFEKI